ncbi:MAG: ABC transporter substrate-binding protein, partial [Armatimonadetes bacterium]|nr:ABC transporter substrate-binding protein [Armatimonadota bacterium]
MSGMLRTVVLLAVACVALSGLAVARAAPAPPATLRIAVGVDMDTLEPASQTTTTVANVIDYFFEPLVDTDFKTGKIIPKLATAWRISPDGLTYTFTLRRGVKFHDGTDFNAQAVKYTIDRLLDPKTTVPIRFIVAAIKQVEVVDPNTVRFILSKPDPVLLANITTTQVAVISPTTGQRLGQDRLRLNPTGAGTGPYLFKEWVRGDRVVVERNPNYWGKKPTFERVEFRIVPDAGTRLTQLLAGDVHMAMLPPAPEVKKLRNHASVKVVEALTDRVIFIGMNNNWGPLKDVKVRQAMNYAINKKAILASILFDLGVVNESPCNPAMFGYHAVQAGGWSFDSGKAKQLLAEAGYKDGFQVELISPTGRYIQDFQFAQAVAAQLSNVKVRASVRTMDWPTYVRTLVTPPDRTALQMFVLGWAWPSLDCDGVLYGQFHSSSAPPRGLAPAFYKNERVDTLLEQARSTVDPERRKTIYK